MLLERNMSEREHFSTKETSIDQYKDAINLKLGERTNIPFTGGIIIYAETDSGNKVIIKKTARIDQAEHEWEGLKIAFSTGISVPTPIALINFDHEQLAIVSSLVEGNNLYYFPDQNVKGEIGKQVRQLHERAEVVGEQWESTGRKSFEYFDKYMFNWSRGKIPELELKSKSAVLLSMLTTDMEQFCKQSTPVFNHNDLHDGQVIVDKNGKPTIIDFGNWMEETWMNEIGYHLFHLIRTDRSQTDDFANFMEGYSNGEKLSESERSSINFYLLFISSRALTYFYKNKSPYLSIAKDTHNKVLQYLDNEELWKNT